MQTDASQEKGKSGIKHGAVLLLHISVGHMRLARSCRQGMNMFNQKLGYGRCHQACAHLALHNLLLSPVKDCQHCKRLPALLSSSGAKA